MLALKNRLQLIFGQAFDLSDSLVKNVLNETVFATNFDFLFTFRTFLRWPRRTYLHYFQCKPSLSYSTDGDNAPSKTGNSIQIIM